MNLWHHLKQPPWRTLVLLVCLVTMFGLGYLLWSPGKVIRDGRHDLRTHGIWIQHGWLGDDSWFQRNRKDPGQFRDRAKVQSLADLLASHGVKYVFPHLCPCQVNGTIAPVDEGQTKLFLDHFATFDVLPWIGGVFEGQCWPASKQWRTQFVASAVGLLEDHPRLAGVHVNIEPMPTGNADFLTLLDELRQDLPAGKILSVAAYPPPTRWQPSPEVHWDRNYFREVASRADQMVPMMYDTAIRSPKLYQSLMASWTTSVLSWSGDAQVLLGIPAYDDAGVGYHLPEVENLRNSLLGIHAGLSKHTPLPRTYGGVAIYSEWEMDQTEWSYFRREFQAAEPLPRAGQNP
jgi:hypothetical protein